MSHIGLLGHHILIVFYQPNPVDVIPGGLAGIIPGLERLKVGDVSAKKLVVRPTDTA